MRHRWFACARLSNPYLPKFFSGFWP